ncbi:hypothetical protein CapIbe_018583 [Capra ibex]
MQPGRRPGPGMGFFHTLPSPPSSWPQTPRSLRRLGALASFLETCFLPHLPGHIKTAVLQPRASARKWKRRRHCALLRLSEHHSVRNRRRFRAEGDMASSHLHEA